MRIRNILWVLALMGILVFVASAAGIDGKWKSEMPGRDGQTRTNIYTFKADGEKLTGSISGGMGGEQQIQDGKVKGDDISFVVVRNFQGNEMKMEYKGKVSGDELKMTMQFGEMPAREIVAKRVKE